MRALLLPFLLSSLLLGGCLGGGDDPAPPATSPPATTPEPTPIATPEPPVTTTPATTPPPPQAKQVYNGTHDFSKPSQPNAPPRRENFTVEAGYAKLQFRTSWTSSAPAGDVSLGVGASIKLFDPAGNLALECKSNNDPNCTKDLDAAAGAWIVDYSGSGTHRAALTITAVP